MNHQGGDLLKNITDLLQDTESLLLDLDMRTSASDVIILDDSTATDSGGGGGPVHITSDDDDDGARSNSSANTSRRRRANPGGVRRRNLNPRTTSSYSDAARRITEMLSSNAAVVDLCSPMAAPPTVGPTTRRGRRGSGSRTTRGRTRRTSDRNSSSSESVNLLDDSLIDMAVPGPSREDNDAGGGVATTPLDTSVTGTGGGPSCPICISSWKQPVSTLCGHIFCKNCIAQWLKVNKSCPVCKAGPSKLKTHPIFIA